MNAVAISAAIGAEIRALAEIRQVVTDGDVGTNGLGPLHSWPGVVVSLGPSDYGSYMGLGEDEYLMEVRILVVPAQTAEGAVSLGVAREAIRNAFRSRRPASGSLDSLCEWCQLATHSGLESIEWFGTDYLGYRAFIRVLELEEHE